MSGQNSDRRPVPMPKQEYAASNLGLAEGSAVCASCSREREHLQQRQNKNQTQLILSPQPHGLKESGLNRRVAANGEKVPQMCNKWEEVVTLDRSSCSFQ